MPWIYMFDEEAGLLTKIGKAKKHYHDRFRDQQPCNPRTLTLRAAIWFDNEADMKACEDELKTGLIFPNADPRFPLREWYVVGWQKAVAADIWHRHKGQLRPIEPYTRKFQDDLNEGVRAKDGRLFRLYAYVFREEGSDEICKLRFTAYGWEAARQNYVTGNPHNLTLHSRWSWENNEMAFAARMKLMSACEGAHIHFGWFRMSPDGMAKQVEGTDAILCPNRRDHIDRDSKDGRAGYPALSTNLG